MTGWDGQQAPEPYRHVNDDNSPVTRSDAVGFGCGWALSIVGLLTAAGLLLTGLAYWADQLLGTGIIR